MKRGTYRRGLPCPTFLVGETVTFVDDYPMIEDYPDRGVVVDIRPNYGSDGLPLYQVLWEGAKGDHDWFHPWWLQTADGLMELFDL